MTAINITRRESEYHIISDGAHVGNDGTMLSIEPKTYLLPTLPAAVAASGFNLFLPKLRRRSEP